MKTQNLIIVTGLPGTGKTTFAAALAHALQAPHLNTDRIRKEMGMMDQYDPASREKVYRELYNRTKQLLSEGKTVIVDGTFYNQRVRNPYLQLIHRPEQSIRWIEIKAPEELIRQRVSRKRPDSQADYQVYLKIKAAWEPLEASHLVLWSDELTVEDMVGRAQEYLELV